MIMKWLFDWSESIEVNRTEDIDKISDIVADRNFRNNIYEKFLHFIEEAEAKFNSFDPLSEEETMGYIKIEMNKLLDEYTSQEVYKQFKIMDSQNPIVLLCERFKKSSPSVWFKKLEKEIEEAKNVCKLS